MKPLKQSTAFTFRLGPFLDETDGKTQENALTIAVADVLLSKAGGALAAKNEATALTGTGANAHYTCPLDATDTGTLGLLRVFCHVSGALPVWEDFVVLPANVYDSLVAGSDALQVDTIQVGGTVQTAGDAVAKINTIDDFLDTEVAAILAAVDTEVAAILDAVGTSGVVVNAAGLATDAVTEIVNAIKAAVVETEGSYTIQQALSIILAVLAGVTTSSGATLKTPNGAATRVAATINASSERTAMTLTPSA